ncbi:hypothetical protein VTI74DRAFT_9327 [Chaetomium olivicolor]
MFESLSLDAGQLSKDVVFEDFSEPYITSRSATSLSMATPSGSPQSPSAHPKARSAGNSSSQPPRCPNSTASPRPFSSAQRTSSRPHSPHHQPQPRPAPPLPPPQDKDSEPSSTREAIFAHRRSRSPDHLGTIIPNKALAEYNLSNPHLPPPHPPHNVPQCDQQPPGHGGVRRPPNALPGLPRAMEWSEGPGVRVPMSDPVRQRPPSRPVAAPVPVPGLASPGARPGMSQCYRGGSRMGTGGKPAVVV